MVDHRINSHRSHAPLLIQAASPLLGKNCYISTMGMTSHLLASGEGWQVSDVVCTAGPSDPVFEERHEFVCIAAVSEGTFQYRKHSSAALMAPGALLLGDKGTCFGCGH